MRKCFTFIRWVRLLVVVSLLFAGAAGDAAAPRGRFSSTQTTVTDNVTGLVWMRGYAYGYTWFQASSYCPSLSLGGYSSGWRVPTIKELQSIVDVRGWNPAIDPVFYLDSNPTYRKLWTSNNSPSTPGAAWVVDFTAGNSTDAGSGTSLAVRCVH